MPVAPAGNIVPTLGKSVRSLRFPLAGGFLKHRTTFADESGQVLIWASEDAALSSAVSAYLDEGKTQLLFRILDCGGGSRLWHDLQVVDATEQPIGTVKWKGGPIVSKWLMRDVQGREMLSEERMSGLRYAVKVASRVHIGLVALIGTTGTLTLTSSGKDIGAIVNRKGKAREVGLTGKFSNWTVPFLRSATYPA